MQDLLLISVSVRSLQACVHAGKHVLTIKCAVSLSSLESEAFLLLYKLNQYKCGRISEVIKIRYPLLSSLPVSEANVLAITSSPDSEPELYGKLYGIPFTQRNQYNPDTKHVIQILFKLQKVTTYKQVEITYKQADITEWKGNLENKCVHHAFI